MAYLFAALAAMLLPSLLAPEQVKSTLRRRCPAGASVAVVIDPTAGVSMDDPQANQVAQRDVETAFLAGVGSARARRRSVRLIIVVRRGTGKMASEPSIILNRIDGRWVVDPIETVSASASSVATPPAETLQRFAGCLPGCFDPDPGGAQNGQITDDRAHPQMEIGNSASNDSFLVYRGRTEKPLDGPVVWRYEEKNEVKPHTVPAVRRFPQGVGPGGAGSGKTALRQAKIAAKLPRIRLASRNRGYHSIDTFAPCVTIPPEEMVGESPPFSCSKAVKVDGNRFGENSGDGRACSGQLRAGGRGRRVCRRRQTPGAPCFDRERRCGTATNGRRSAGSGCSMVWERMERFRGCRAW